MNIENLEKKVNKIIEERFTSNYICSDKLSSDDNEVIMLIPFVDNKHLLINVSGIKKSEIEISQIEGVFFINLLFDFKRHRYISRVLDKLCLCCRNNYLLNSLKNIDIYSEEQKKELLVKKEVPYIITPDLIFNISKEIWEKIENKDFTKIDFNIIVSSYDILEKDDTSSSSKPRVPQPYNIRTDNIFGRNIYVIGVDIS